MGNYLFPSSLNGSTNKVIVQFDALDNEGYNIYLFHKPISNIILGVLICKLGHYNVFLMCFLGFGALNLKMRIKAFSFLALGQPAQLP